MRSRAICDLRPVYSAPVMPCPPPPLPSARPASGAPTLELREPALGHGLTLWNLARVAGGLDLNSAYSYHLWCRDFASSSVIAWSGGEAAGFVTGFRRELDATCLFVWQVAVHPDHRGVGLGVDMLSHLAGRHPGDGTVEATVTPSNEASRRMFERFADRHGATVTQTPFLGAEAFPDDHEAEVLLEIGPLWCADPQPTLQPTESR
jgi:L-2,4-diaminobutyric acid acetyltransferase